ncbi:hypothetical protein ACFLSY_10360 [Bacteroidota bacterium]
MRKRRLYFPYVLSLILSIFLISQGIKLKSKISIIIRSNENFLILENHINNIKNNQGIQYQSEGVLINNNIPLITVNYDTILFKDIINEKPKIILYFSEASCSKCFEEELDNLNNISKQIGNDNIAVLASFDKIQYLAKLIRLKQIKFPIYCLNHARIGLPIENNKIPFLFVTNSNYMSSDIFIPYTDMPSLADQYYEIMIHKYFNNNY